MKKIFSSGALIFLILFTTSPAHAFFDWFSPKPAKFKIIKVNSNKKYLHLMTRTRGILGTSNWGKFNYDVVSLPYEKQGEYFIVTWNRRHGPKEMPENVTLRIEYKHQNGVMGKIEKNYTQLGRGRHQVIFENTGDRFVDNGEIDLWRVSLLSGDQVVAEKESALWWTVSHFKS